MIDLVDFCGDLSSSFLTIDFVLFCDYFFHHYNILIDLVIFCSYFL